VVVGNTGLLLNNGMRLGSTSPYPDNPNYVGPGKVPILNNSPVVVLKDGRVAFVFGTSGGETIGQTEFQMLVNLVDFELPVQQAIEAPRFALDAAPNFYKPAPPSACRSRTASGATPLRRSRRSATTCACCRAGAASATCRRSASISRRAR
jgi:gamma-glutamyltranspeptidase